MCNEGQKVLGRAADCKKFSASIYCLHTAKRESAFPAEREHLIFSQTSFLGMHAMDQHSTSLDSVTSTFNCGKSISKDNSPIRENVIQSIDFSLGEAYAKLGETSVETPRSITSALDRQEISKDERLTHFDSGLEDEDDDIYRVQNVSASSSSILSLLKTEPLIWKPPEPANVEDDMDSVANNDDDDDDDYIDGNKWGRSISLGDFDKVHGNTYKVARQKAMVSAMNGQFKILVSKFLASEGLAFASDNTGWLDIVTSLSWEAALFIKPDAKEGRAMDPGSYVKVKCVATGAPYQSQVIKGLIFKKNAAHKHMPTKCKNPKLLLVKGVLGQRELGLSSFDSMDQEKDYLKSVNEMIEACHPNLVLVEKSASRDIQEFLLAKGMTLIFDMKIARLERIACCTGSQIIPAASILTNLKIKQCDLFRIEKFTEEHNFSTEAGKKSSKTLMFLEGFSKPLGCTILLKGAHIGELKRVKRVIQYTIFAAYHLILETSFFADQRALFSNIDCPESINPLTSKSLPILSFGAAPSSNSFSDTSAINGFLESSANEKFYTSHFDASRSLNDLRLVCDIDFCEDNFTKSLSNNLTSENAVIQSRSQSSSNLTLQLIPSFLSDSLPSSFDFNDEGHDYLSLTGNPVSSSTETIDDVIESNEIVMEEKSNHDFFENESETLPPTSNKPAQYLNAVVGTSTTEHEGKDDSDGVLSPESILVLLSKQCVEKGVVCEQSHLSRIKYYGNFDVSLGRYLQDVLLNQKHACSSCGEPPEAHIYSYTHQNGNLTVLVRQLPSFLLGEIGGKIWMWSRCLKCELENGIPRSTKRVVMSNAARSLSFGKFLELSFTSHSAASKLSSECGHSLHRDCLRFFGLGSKVAVFRYSPVDIYAACKPPPVLEFSIQNEQEWVIQEAKSVLQRGDIFFLEVANFLRNLKTSCYSSPFVEQYTYISGFVKNICEAESILIHEKAEFEASLFETANSSGQPEKSVKEGFGLSWFNQELLLGIYIWDRRLYQLTQIGKDFDRSYSYTEIEKANIQYVNVEFRASDHNNLIINPQQSAFDNTYTYKKNCVPECDDISQNSGFYKTECLTKAAAFDSFAEENVQTTVGKIALSSITDFEDPESLVWVPFSILREAFKKDLVGGYLQKFSFIRTYTPKYLSPMHQLFPQERGLLHYPVGASKKIMAVSEDEISSIIACALALSEDQNYLLESMESNKDVFAGKISAENNLSSIVSEGFMSSTQLASNGFYDSTGTIHFSRSFSLLYSDELSSSALESSLSLDRLITSENLHPEISLGIGKEGVKKHSVVCIHAKQFYALRKMCCPSEQDYISSLSRCRTWDAQGGKSKAIFAKSMDDRFIIKQIKKAELDSFLKFAAYYFKHITHSLSTGSQTCLAKILGIYQVRLIKSGKEVKIDLMVMENLLFGRNVTRTYDLKGALFSRYISNINDHPEKVLLDQNFVEDMRLSPIYVGGRTKHLLQRAIWNDTSFLNAINVMDYSLLVGVDKKQQHLIFGIIDYLRQYTWDKQLETWVKASLVVPKNSLPTIISPKEYKKRFRKFMSRYFLTVPDSWCSAECLETCRFCTAGISSSCSHGLDPPEQGY